MQKVLFYASSSQFENVTFISKQNRFNYTIDAPVKQQFKLADEKGSYQTKGSIQEPMTVKQYAKLANDGVYKQPPHSNHDELERKYWKTLSFCPPIYGCDVADSLTDSDQKSWNMADLKTILNYVNDDYNQQLKGVNSPYLYFGMWKATFSWHVEDMDLYSINYLHHGAPKTWYCVPPQYGYLLEAAARQLFPDVASWCSNFMRHKTCLISPQVLDKMGVPYQKVVQEERNAIIVFPYAYHSGFNHGFNIAESTNFALERWIEYGKRARQCDCQRSRVMFSMDTFVKRYQPEIWESWKKGTDIKPHPEDPPDVVAEFDLRKANPKEYARLKQEQFLKRNVKYKSPVKVRPNYSDAKSKETKIAPDHSSQDTKLYYVYQHHEYSNVKVTVDPDTMAIFGNGKDLLEKFIDADDIDVRDLIENSILIKIGDKVQNNPVESEIARKVAKLPAVKELVHVYQHFELSITARINPKTMELEGGQSNELQEYLKDQRDIKQLISLGIFKFTYEEYSTDSAYKSISDSNITDKDTYDKTLTIHNNMGTFTPNKIDKTMELMDLITGHIYMDLTSNELVTYLPKCQKFVGTVTDRMVHLFNGKSIHDLVQEGKLVKVGQRRLCPEEALSLVKEKVKLNRCVLNLKVGNACELLAVEVATHQSIPNRIVFAISRGNDDMKYDEAKRALENNPIKNLLDENILVKPLNNSCKRSNYNVKGEILLSALQHECKLIKCSDHIDELKTMASKINSSDNTDCKCALTGLLPLRRALLGNRTKTASKSLIIRVQEYCNTVSMENRPSDELYVVKEGSLPSDFTLEEYKSDEEHAEDDNGGEQSLQTLTDETANGNGIQTRRKRKLIDIDDIRDPYDSEEGEAEIIPKFDSDESKGEESSDDPDYGEKGSNSYQWRSKRVAKKKKSKHLVHAASRVGVPGFVLDNRRDSVDKSAGNKSKKVLSQTADPSLLSTANALINYFEDDENLDEDFNLIFYTKELAKKLGQESHQFLEVLKIFKEFQIVTRVMKKPQDKEQSRFEWNGIEECNLNEVLLQIYHGKKDDVQDKESPLWEVCVDILKTLTHSRKVRYIF